jgi:receptor protein-tyrosine kinase
MDLLKRAWLITKRRWPLIVMPIVIALAAVTLYDALMPRQYSATTTLFLRAPDVKTSASAYQGNLFTMQRANTYVEMIKSDDLAQLVVDRLGLDMTAHDLASRVSAEPIRDTVIINISAKDKDKQQAANLANTYGTEFASYVAKVEAANLAPDTPPLVTTVKPAAAEDATTNLLSRRLPLWLTFTLVGVLGLVIGILLTWLAERYDTRIRSRRQIEEVTHSRVLGNLSPQRSLQGSESVDDVYANSPQFADEARALSITTEHALREVSKVNGSSVLAITSVNDGDGKSVVARALASALNERGHRVGLLQVNGAPSEADNSRTQRIPTGSKANDVQFRFVGAKGATSEHAMGAAIEDLSNVSDFIVIDAHGSGASPQAQIAAMLSDVAVIIVRPGQTDENSLADLVNAMTMLETPVIGIVTNGAKETNTSGRYYA